MVAAVYAILRSRERLGGALAVLGDRDQADGRAAAPVRDRGRRSAARRAGAADLLIGAGVDVRRARVPERRRCSARAPSIAVDDRSAARARATGTASPGVSRPGSAWSRPAMSSGTCWRGRSWSCSCWLVRRVWRGQIDWIDGARLGDRGDARGRQLAAAVVRGVAAAVRGARRAIGACCRTALVTHRRRACWSRCSATFRTASRCRSVAPDA